MTGLLDAASAAAVLAGLPAAFLTYGASERGDLDAAFDDASEAAGYDFGFAGLTPSIARVDASSCIVRQGEPVTVERASLLAGQDLRGGGLTPGVAYARAVALPRTFARRRVRLVVTDPDASFAEQAGLILDVSPELEKQVGALAAAVLADGPVPMRTSEVLERLEVTAARHTFRARAETNRGPSVSEFVVVTGGGSLLSRGHRTASDARRDAVATLKAGPGPQGPTGSLQVMKLVGRAERAPLILIHRDRVRTRITAKVSLIALKDPTKAVRVCGWLFYGQL